MVGNSCDTQHSRMCTKKRSQPLAGSISCSSVRTTTKLQHVLLGSLRLESIALPKLRSFSSQSGPSFGSPNPERHGNEKLRSTATSVRCTHRNNRCLPARKDGGESPSHSYDHKRREQRTRICSSAASRWQFNSADRVFLTYRPVAAVVQNAVSVSYTHLTLPTKA